MNLGYKAWNKAAKRTRLGLIFLPAGTGAPTWAGGVAPPGVASISRTGVGTFLITLNEKWVGLDSFEVSLMLNAAADTQAELKGETVSTTKTITVALKTAGAYADVASNANNRVSVVLYLKATTSD